MILLPDLVVLDYHHQAPPERRRLVPAEQRQRSVPAEHRLLRVPPEQAQIGKGSA
jgi:hypothetical protein